MRPGRLSSRRKSLQFAARSTLPQSVKEEQFDDHTKLANATGGLHGGFAEQSKTIVALTVAVCAGL